jgi:hypothetical protein
MPGLTFWVKLKTYRSDNKEMQILKMLVESEQVLERKQTMQVCSRDPTTGISLVSIWWLLCKASKVAWNHLNFLKKMLSTVVNKDLKKGESQESGCKEASSAGRNISQKGVQCPFQSSDEMPRDSWLCSCFGRGIYGEGGMRLGCPPP